MDVTTVVPRLIDIKNRVSTARHFWFFLRNIGKDGCRDVSELVTDGKDLIL